MMLVLWILGAVAAPLIFFAVDYYYNVVVEGRIQVEEARIRYYRAYDRLYEEMYYHSRAPLK